MGLPNRPGLESTAGNDCLAGGGVMRAMMRSKDWSQTLLGPVENWSQSLCTTLSVCLNSRFPILIWWGEELTMLYNDAFRPILGSTKHPQALGQPGKDCWPEIWDSMGPMLSRVKSTGEATWSEDHLLLLNRNGFLEECYFTFSNSPIREASGIGGVFTTITETTERVLANRRMQTLRDLAANTANVQNAEQVCALAGDVLVKNVRDIPFALIYLLDEGENQAYLQSAAGVEEAPPQIDLLGEASSLNLPFTRAVQDGQPHLIRDLQAAIPHLSQETGAPASQTALVIPIIRPGQESPYGLLVCGISPQQPFDEPYSDFLTLAAGQIAVAIASARALDEARRRVEAMAELDRVKMEFFSNISHEFRTPLTLMLGPLEDILRSADPGTSDADRERLETVYRNGLRLLKLVNTLLDFTRLESGHAEGEFAPVDLAALTTDLASMFRAAIEDAGLRLTVDCPPLPKPVYVDIDMWEKIVLNLISNAFKFTRNGEIFVALRWKGDFVALEVRDTGIGIASEDLAHIFDRFHRVHSTRGRSYEGSGIGLSLVRELARIHGGQISVESTPDNGSTFTVTIRTGTTHLPASQTRAARSLFSTNIGTRAYLAESALWLPRRRIQTQVAQEDGEAGKADEAHADALILIADDNTDMQEYLTHLLSPYWQTEVVSNGIEVLEAVEYQLPDLIISDVMMPGMDGIELLHRLRANPKTREIPIILLSARAGEEQQLAGIEHGADDYLVKPFSARELIARIESRLELTALRREAQHSLIEQQLEYHTRLEVHRQLLDSREMERQQIARELHDGPIQDLIGLMYSLQSVLALTEDDSMDEYLRGLRDTVQKLVIELRVVCNELRPPSLVQFGLERAIRTHIESFQEKNEQIKIHAELAEDGRLLPEKYRLALYRIYQECLNNVVRHANASEARIALIMQAENIVLEIADNGCGFQVPTDWVSLARHGHLGLVGMKERAEAIGGQMEVSSEPGRGTRVRVTIPLPPGAAA